MNVKLIVAIAAVVITVGVGASYVLRNNMSGTPRDNLMSKEEAQDLPAQQSDPAPEPSSGQTPAGGTYADYTEEGLKSAKGKRILFFHAPWCPQCRELDASIRSGAVPDGVAIFKVDYDSNQKLRQLYGVTIQTTLVLLDENGNLQKKYVAYDEPSIEAVKENLL